MNIEQQESHRQHGPGHIEHNEHVEVIYNGLEKKVELKPTETLGVLRQAALNAFHISQQPHLLSLFTQANVEFGPNQDGQSVCEAGIHNGEKLLLRPGVVRGG
jgi:hypothetical protein